MYVEYGGFLRHRGTRSYHPCIDGFSRMNHRFGGTSISGNLHKYCRRSTSEIKVNGCRLDRLDTVGLRTPAMPQGLLLPRMSPTFSVAVAWNYGTTSAIIIDYHDIMMMWI